MLAVLAVLALIVWGVVAAKNRRASNANKEIDGVVERVREIAWQYRDVSPELSAVLLDEVRVIKNEREITK